MTVFYCQSCGLRLNATQVACPACGWSYGGQPIPTAIPTLEKRKLPVRAEIGVCVDRTASSEQFANAILMMIAAILHGVSSKAAEVKCWLQSHGDLECHEHEVLHSDGVEPKQLAQDLLDINFAGGGDPAETHLDALERLANLIPFTSNQRIARGVIVAFLTDESKRLRSGKSPEQLGNELASRGLLTYLVCEPNKPRLTRFAQAAHALVIPITKNPSADVVNDVVAKIAASIVQTLATGGTVPIDVSAEVAADFSQNCVV